MYRLLQIPKPSINRSSFPYEINGVFNHHSKPELDAFHPPLSSSIKSCKGIAVCVSNNHPVVFTRGGGEEEEEERERSQVKVVDVATLGNLCVDVVLNVPELPPASLDERKAYMERLADSRPDKKYWEAGGNCNLAIAAARLGLHCVTLGHVGSEIYGRFLLNVLQEERIVMVGMDEDTDVAKSSSYETLLCWVLVDSLQRHGFCSRADFSKEPAFSWMSRLTGEVKMAIKQSKILFFNGYVFDELVPGLITTTLEYAIDVGTAIFFDPGPRGKYLIHGTPEQQKAITLLLKMSNVLLLTADEAEALTGKTNPILAGQDLIRKGMCVKWVIIKMGAHGSILITASTITCAPAFKVDVVDTVGCGDSCTAAVVVSFLHGISPVGTLALTNAVGAATAMGCGAGRNVATTSKVLELLRVSNLNEDDELWNDLIDNVDATEISLLSKTVINGSCDRLSRVPMQIAVSELLPKLETLLKRRAVPS